MHFIGIKGEGWEVQGTDELTLLCASDGSELYDPNGIPFFTVLQWLFSIKCQHPDAVFVTHCASWEITHILKALREKARRELLTHGVVNISCPHATGVIYRLEYRAGKWLTVSLRYFHEFRYRTAMTVTLYDLFGYQSCSLLEAVARMRCAARAELYALLTLRPLKSQFGPGMIGRVRDYTRTCCNLHAKYADAINTALLSEGIRIHKWHGPGVIASSILRANNVKDHIHRPADDDVNSAVLSAYYGGRIQTLQVGIFSQNFATHTTLKSGVKVPKGNRPYYGYDIHSAYPSAMAELPSMRDAEAVRLSEYDPSFPVAIYKVTWEVPASEPFGPFPFRMYDMKLEYPRNGTGWHHAVELDAARETFPSGTFTVLEGIGFKCPHAAERPFTFVRALYNRRREKKRARDHSQLVLKLALNSLYGKLAQGAAYFSSDAPSSQSYIYAGLVTAMTRAKILRATAKHRAAVLEICTDGLITSAPLPVKISSDLGGWKRTPYASVFIIKSGFHRLTPLKGKDVIACRGFRLREVNWRKLERCWLKFGPAGVCSIKTQQFQSLALDTRHPGRWETVKKRLAFWPRRNSGPEPTHPFGWTYRIPSERSVGESSQFVPGLYGNLEDSDAISQMENVLHIEGD